MVKVTYKPPPFSPTLKGLMPRLPTEQQFLRAIFNPRHTPFYGDAQPPVEMFLTKELSNPHSRAKKQKRWQQYKVYKKNLLKEYTDAEIKANPTRLHSELKAGIDLDAIKRSFASEAPLDDTESSCSSPPSLSRSYVSAVSDPSMTESRHYGPGESSSNSAQTENSTSSSFGSVRTVKGNLIRKDTK